MRRTITSAFLAGMCLVLGCSKQFSGDGVVTDSGFWSYPRYAIAFGSLDATNRAHRTYQFTGAPAAKMTFGFVVVGDRGGEDAANALRGSEGSRMTFHIRIAKAGGAEVASVEASLKDWQVSQSPEQVMLWHEKLRDVNFDRKWTYKIFMDVSRTGDATTPFLLRPVLKGGGNETP